MKNVIFILFCILISSGSFEQVSINTDSSTPDNSAMLDVKSTSKGFLPPRMTMAQRDAIGSPSAGLVIFCTDCNTNGALQIFLNGQWSSLNLNKRPVASNVSQSGSPLLNYVLTGSYTYSDVDSDPEGTSFYNWYRADNISGLNEVQIPGASGISYMLVTDDVGKYIRFAVTPVSQTGDSPGNQVKSPTYLGPVTTWTCGIFFTINHLSSGGVAPVDKSVTYGSTTNVPGETSKCWITSNLGADHQATAVNDATEASAGWYWQFNRKQGYKHDGTTRTPSTTWITPVNENFDWLAVNDPCTLEFGSSWRIPTTSEWTNVSVGWLDWNGPWNSALKMHVAGLLVYYDGSLSDRGSNGYYWTSTQSSGYHAWILFFNGGQFTIYGLYGKDNGFPLRCLRE